MLSSSPSKIHEPRVTGVSPRPTTSDSARKLRNTSYPVGAENYVTRPDQRLRGRPGDRRPATGDQHDRSLWPSDSPTSRSDAC
jgi:hypothetical protein